MVTLSTSLSRSRSTSRLLVPSMRAPGALRPPFPARAVPLRTGSYVPTRTNSTSTRRAIALDLPPLSPSPASSSANTQAVEPTSYEPLPRSLAYRRGLLLLHVPVPPARWPARLEMASALLSQANAVLKGTGIAVNAIWDGDGDAGVDAFDGEGGAGETYRARLLYPDGKVFAYDTFDAAVLTSGSFARDVGYVPDQAAAVAPGGQRAAQGRAEILVCTHGSRDCRCADRGGALVHALRDEVERRKMGGRVTVGEIAHVGGHKYAANAITLPSLDMFSNLAAGDAGKLLDHLAATSTATEAESQTVGGNHASRRSPIWTHWRGRYGLTEEQQATLWDAVDPARSSPQAEPEGSAGGLVESHYSSHAPPPVAETVMLRFKTWEGDVREVPTKIGQTLLEVGKAHDLPSLEGTCGGNLECATCHLYIPASASPTVPPPPIAEASDEEFDMLGYAVGCRDGASRLGCQIKVDAKLGEWVRQGGVIGLPRF